MDDDLKNKYIDYLMKISIGKTENYIKSLATGFYVNNCKIIFGNYLIHVCKDIESLSKVQEKTLVRLINKYNYGR